MAFCHTIRGLVVNPGTFAFNDVLTSALIEAPWDAEGEKTFSDIEFVLYRKTLENGWVRLSFPL